MEDTRLTLITYQAGSETEIKRKEEEMSNLSFVFS